MQKRGKERSSGAWIGPPVMVAVVVLSVIGVYLFFSHEQAIHLKYGEFKQVLLDNTVTFQKVHVGRSEIRGEILLYALDESGDVWRFDDKSRQWVMLPRNRR